MNPTNPLAPTAVRLLGRALTDGSLAGVVTMAALALLGRREAGSGVAPINATSHVLYGDEAGTADRVDAKHTLPGLLINTGAGIFWALVRELTLARTKSPGPAKAAAAGAATAGLAYAVDYHLIPRRLTPGWERRLSRKSVALGFVALGVALTVAGIVRARR
jgi:hypothetical protein